VVVEVASCCHLEHWLGAAWRRAQSLRRRTSSTAWL
jgi:hypothetical protein